MRQRERHSETTLIYARLAFFSTFSWFHGFHCILRMVFRVTNSRPLAMTLNEHYPMKVTNAKREQVLDWMVWALFRVFMNRVNYIVIYCNSK